MLESNELGTEGAKLIGESLKQNSSLKILNLGSYFLLQLYIYIYFNFIYF